MPEKENNQNPPKELELTESELLSKVPTDVRPQITTLIEKASFFSGPLPHPELLKQYEEALPGSAERIVKMAEEEQGLRKKAVHGLISTDQLRVVGSIVISLVMVAGLIGGAIYCANRSLTSLKKCTGISAA